MRALLLALGAFIALSVGVAWPGAAAAGLPAASDTTAAQSHPGATTPTATTPPAPAPTAAPAASATTPSTTTTSTTATKPAKPKKPKPPPPQPPLSVTPGAAAFPERALMVWPPAGRSISPGQVHITENGQPVSGLSLTPLSNSGPGQFGVVVVVNQDLTMSSGGLAQAMVGLRGLASQRTVNQQLGVITFAQSPSVMLPLTSDGDLIGLAIGNTPWTSTGTQVLPALSAAYQQLANAQVTSGVVILITDSADSPLQSSARADAVTDAAAGMGIQTWTIGLHDGTYSPTTTPLLKNLDTSFSLTDPAHLPQTMTRIWSQVSRGVLVRYRSQATPGSHVNVQMSVDGLAGTDSLTYTAPRLAPAAPHPVIRSLAGFSPLSPVPSFALAPAPAPPQVHLKPSFWTSSTSISIIATICALLLAGGVLLAARAAKQPEIRSRIAGFIGDYGADEDLEGLSLEEPDATPQVLARRRWWPRFVEDVRVSRFRRSAVSLVKLAGLGSLVGGVLLSFVMGSVAGILLAAPLGPVVLWAVVRRAARRQRTRFADQLPSYLQEMASAVRGGRSLVAAIAAIADGADQPIQGEFERVVRDEQLGQPLEQSLQEIARDMQSEDVEQIVLIAVLHRQAGSNVAESIERVADGARERAELRRELAALTSQARLSSRVLTGLPIFLLVALSFLAPSYSQPILHTTGGLIVLGICAVMVAIGWMVMNRIVRLEP